MPNITVSLSNTENKCLEYVAESPATWLDNAATERARIAKEEIIALLVAHCNANNVQIATGEDAQITQAYTLGVVDTAANRNAADSSP
jgi:phosphoribosylaminoimidazole (AIR) synthetase